MGGVILIFLLALLVTILVLPAVRERMVRKPPPDGPKPEPAHEVVHRLDDHRRRKPPGDDPQTR